MVNYKNVVLTLAFLAALFASLSLTPWEQGQKGASNYVPLDGLRVPESGIGNIGIDIFTTYVFSFEILALVLTAALVGAIYLARKEVA
jgi:F420H2 dehydrogenase subunit J